MSFLSVPRDDSVVGIPALQDNYIWLCINPHTKSCIVVDPGDAQAVLLFLEKQAIQLSAIFITHHHADHTAGIGPLCQRLCGATHTASLIPVYGPKRETIPYCTHPVSEGDTLFISGFSPFHVLDTPGHTLGHIAYYGAGMLFCGDTLFTGGCGRLFEGTPADLLESLQKINRLPANTRLYCAHEYTQKNLEFALRVEPQNRFLQKRLKAVCALRKKNRPTVPSTLALEQKTNPFLRTHSPEIIARIQSLTEQKETEALAVFTLLRAWKDNF